MHGSRIKLRWKMYYLSDECIWVVFFCKCLQLTQRIDWLTVHSPHYWFLLELHTYKHIQTYTYTHIHTHTHKWMECETQLYSVAVHICDCVRWEERRADLFKVHCSRSLFSLNSNSTSVQFLTSAHYFNTEALELHLTGGAFFTGSRKYKWEEKKGDFGDSEEGRKKRQVTVWLRQQWKIGQWVCVTPCSLHRCLGRPNGASALCHFDESVRCLVCKSRKVQEKERERERERRVAIEERTSMANEVS